MATLISEQGETVERIDELIGGAQEYTSAAKTELSKALERVSKNRSLILKVFLILLFFIIIFIIFG